MVRAGSRAPSTGRAPSVNKVRKARDKPYKVHIESVMTKKKKLKLHDIHGSAKPLNGYTYLPVGFSDLAEECKEASRRKDVDVAVVSAGSRTAANDPSKLSHHIYRVGYHFRTDIFDEACNKLGYCERNGKLEKITGMEQPSRFEKTMSRYGSRFDAIDVNNRSEEESKKVKKHIRELFPKIPEADLQEIYERAWEQGATTVGNADNLSLSRQVQLATIARIRHTYTDYDHLLRVGSWKDARTAVEHKCLAKLIEWRGEHDNDDEELEEILRETIVIDDESDDDDDDDDENDGESDSSLEIVQHTIAPKDLRVEPNETRSFRGFNEPRRRVQNRTLPAAIQARWRSARSERYGPKFSQPEESPTSRITVTLDNLGQAPRTFQSGGMRFVRVSPDPQTPPRNSTLQNTIPGVGDMVGPGNGYGAPYPYHVPHERPYSLNGGIHNGNISSAPRAAGPMDHRDGLPSTAVLPSIENPQDAPPAMGLRPLYSRASTVVDLTTPPKPMLRGDYANSINPPLDDRNRHMIAWNQPYERFEDVRYLQDRPRSQAPARAPAQVKPPMSRHHSGMDVIDLTRDRDYPMSSRGRHSYPDHNAVQHTRPPPVEHVYRPPVYGQAAYPQTYHPSPATPPRPVHGAPSNIQPVTVIGTPSPRGYYVRSKKPVFRVSDK